MYANPHGDPCCEDGPDFPESLGTSTGTCKGVLDPGEMPV